MNCQNCWKKLLPFGLTLTLGFFAVSVNRDRNKDQKVERKEVYIVTGVESKEISKLTNKESFPSECSRLIRVEEDIKSCANSENANVFITSKPRASYTELARLKETQGQVTLKVTFLADGKIGRIRLVKGLPDGLSEQAITAAKKIKFEPARKKGISYNTTKLIQYGFTIY